MAEVNDVNFRYARAEDLKDGNIATIESAFERKGNFDKYTANIDLLGNKVQLSVNDTSISYMVSAWGNKTDKWIGKQIIMKYEDLPQRKNVRIWKPYNKEESNG